MSQTRSKSQDPFSEDVRFGRVLDELLSKQERGEPLDRVELRAEFPDWADELLDQLALARELRVSQVDVAILVKQSVLRPAKGAVADAELDVAVTRPVEAVARLMAKLLDELDGENLCR